jgi:hypothetical protein
MWCFWAAGRASRGSVLCSPPGLGTPELSYSQVLLGGRLKSQGLGHSRRSTGLGESCLRACGVRMVYVCRGRGARRVTRAPAARTRWGRGVRHNGHATPSDCHALMRRPRERTCLRRCSVRSVGRGRPYQCMAPCHYTQCCTVQYPSRVDTRSYTWTSAGARARPARGGPPWIASR